MQIVKTVNPKLYGLAHYASQPFLLLLIYYLKAKYTYLCFIDLKIFRPLCMIVFAVSGFASLIKRFLPAFDLL